MTTLESLGKVLSTDILVVGGGIAGLTASITAKEESPNVNVLIAEKATTGYAGKAPKGGGVLAYVTAQDNPDEFVRFHVNNVGYFLEDQELLKEYAYTGQDVIEHFGRMGVPLARNDDGSLKYQKHRGDELPWGLTAVDLDMCLKLRRTAIKLGVKAIDKVSIVDLLKDGDRVVGAIGFDIIDGTCYVIKAKATILANGSQNFRIMPMWSCGRGDGIAAAYRAGAEMRNAELGSFVNLIYTASKNVASRAEDHMYNAKGEFVSPKYRPHPEMESDISVSVGIGWYKEILAGNGPIYAAHADGTPWEAYPNSFGGTWNREVQMRPGHAEFNQLLEKKGRAALKDISKPEVIPGVIGEMSPVKVDHMMATNVPGLFAVGDTSYNGSAWGGAVPCPPGRMRGSGLMNAIFAARKGGPAAARYVAAGAAEPNVDAAQAAALKERVFAPLKRDSGVAAIDLVHAVQEVMSPVKYSQYRSEARMKEALSKVLEVKGRLDELKAKDTHDLSACNEARSMALCAEMFFRASLERKESRGWFVREDYPEMDNKDCLKWIVLKDRGGEMSVSTERIPIERYPVKP